MQAENDHCFTLEIHCPNLEPRTTTFGHGEVTLGRAVDNTLRLNDITVSSRHAKIAWFHEPPYIQDLGSTNGTYVNDRRIGRVTLNDGDRIKIGSAIIAFHWHPGRAPTTAVPSPQGVEDLMAQAKQVGLGQLPHLGLPAEWIHWVAQDATGHWWGFESQPTPGEHGWLEQELGNYVKIGMGVPKAHWRGTLFKL